MVSKTKSKFTNRELELINLAFQCCSSKPDIDYELLATKAGLKGAKSARDTFGPIWKKLTSGLAATTDGEGSPGEPPPGGEKATPKKRKCGDTEGEETPTKRKGTPRKGPKAAVKTEELDEKGVEKEGEDGEGAVEAEVEELGEV